MEGLRPDSEVTLQLSSQDAQLGKFASKATFVADGEGLVDVTSARAESGDYVGVDPMGLFVSMTPATGRPRYYKWSLDPHEFTIDAQQGESATAKTFTRRSSSEGVLATEVRTNGIVGTYFSAESPNKARRPGVLLVAGSNGGRPLDIAAHVLAAEGYGVLALAYFGVPGLPAELSEIPMEYFEKALRWLESQPDVDPESVAVIGISRGSEAAALAALHFPTLVDSLVLSVPANVAVCSFPGCKGTAWTLGGKALPYTRQFNQPSPSDDPRAVFPVERLTVPVLMTCSGADRVWNSCGYARAMNNRLAAAGRSQPHVLLEYPSAGHAVGLLMPYQPGLISMTTGRFAGTSPRADADALAELWPQVLSFLADATGRPRPR